MVKTLHFHCGEHRFYPWSGNLRSHMLHGQKKKKKLSERNAGHELHSPGRGRLISYLCATVRGEHQHPLCKMSSCPPVGFHLAKSDRFHS